MEHRYYIRKNRLVEWKTIMEIVRKEIEPREYSGDIPGAKHILEQLPQENGFVLKKWADVLFKEAQITNTIEIAHMALAKAISAEAAFPDAKYKHTAKQLQKCITQWIQQNHSISL